MKQIDWEHVGEKDFKAQIVPYAGHEAEWVLSQWHHAREYTISGHTVIIWDEDRDTRVFDAIPLFKNVRLIGEHEGCVNVLLPYAQRLQSSVPGYIEIDNDTWAVEAWETEAKWDQLVEQLKKAEYKEIKIKRPMTYKMHYFLLHHGYTEEALVGMSFEEAGRTIGQITRGAKNQNPR